VEAALGVDQPVAGRDRRRQLVGGHGRRLGVDDPIDRRRGQEVDVQRIEAGHRPLDRVHLVEVALDQLAVTARQPLHAVERRHHLGHQLGPGLAHAVDAADHRPRLVLADQLVAQVAGQLLLLAG